MCTLKAISQLLLVLFALLCGAPAGAHPHVFAVGSVNFGFDDAGLTRVEVRLVFDSVFSSQLMGTFDSDGGSALSQEESRALAADLGEKLAQEGYFLHLYVDGARTEFAAPKAFAVEFDKGHIEAVLSFPVAVEASADATRVAAGLFDPTMYTYILNDEADGAALEPPPGLRIDSHGLISPGPAIDEFFTLPWASQVVFAATNTVAAQPAAPAGNPFGLPAGQGGVQVSAGEATPSWYSRAMGLLIRTQRLLRETMADTANSIRQEPLGPAFWWFMLLALAYGAVHGLGPGHGKRIACGYVAAKGGSLWQTGLLGLLIPAMHVASAVVMVTAFTLLWPQSGALGVQAQAPMLERLSYGLLAFLGLSLLVSEVRDIWQPAAHGRGCEDATSSNRPIVLLALATGLVPCPGASMLLSFAWAQGLVVTGLAAMVAILAGMAATTVLFAWLALAARYSLSALIRGADTTKARLVRHTVALTGGTLVFVTGSGLLWASLAT
jgi:ABC-type nickel/cobalt efflux system permease component RcnA/ABC-type uncharacterized transport system substrate-binding protein